MNILHSTMEKVINTNTKYTNMIPISNDKNTLDSWQSNQLQSQKFAYLS